MSLKKRLHESFFQGLWRLVSSRPRTIVAAGAVLAMASVLGAAFFLRLNSDQDRLVSPEVPFQKRYLELLENFGDQEFLYVVIRTGGTEKGRERARQFADRLARRLDEHPELIRAVYYRITTEDLGPGALLFASTEEAATISQAVTLLTPSLKAWFRDGSLPGFLRQVDGLLSARRSDSAKVDPALFGQALAGLEPLLGKIAATLTGKPREQQPLFELSGIGTRYFFTANDRFLIMRLLPAKDYSSMDVIGRPLAAVRQALAATAVELPEVEAGLTGRPVLQADEMRTTDRDMIRASVLAIILVGVLFIAILHGVLRPLLILSSLLMAMAWAFGFATVTVGELNLLSIVFALVLVGIGVDFGVHAAARYLEAAGNGQSAAEAVRTSLFRTGPGIILGAITSVCAFYAVLGSNFRGLAELGLIGGTGILLCLLAMLTVLPALLLVTGKKRPFPSSRRKAVTLPVLGRLSGRPGRLLSLLAVLTLAALPGLFRTRFNYNLLELQARGLESVKYEKLLIQASDESTWYAILAAETLPEVKRLTEELKALPGVGKVESIQDFLPRDLERKSALYAAAAAALAGIPAAPADPVPPDPAALREALEKLSGTLEELAEKLFAAGAKEELVLLEQTLDRIRSSLAALERSPARAADLDGLQNELRHRMKNLLSRLRLWLTAGEIAPAGLPAAIRDVYIGRDGRYQIKVMPRGNVWNFDELEQFVAELRQVDPLVSGVPVGVLESARLMHRTFLTAAGLTLMLVSLLLWLYSRSARYVLLTLLPLGVGILWLLELMGWAGIDFNLANFFAIPILIAIGVDGGVHFLARWQELEGGGNLFATTTPTAVALSFATTMIGFGGLLLAHHRGLASLGAVMVLGSLTCMMACLLVLPAALKLVGTHTWR